MQASAAGIAYYEFQGEIAIAPSDSLAIQQIDRSERSLFALDRGLCGHGRESRVGVGRNRQVIKTDDRDIAGNGKVCLTQCRDCSNCDRVVAAKQRRGRISTAKNLLHGTIAACHAEISVRDQAFIMLHFRPHERALISFQPLGRTDVLSRSVGYVRNSTVA